MPLRSCHRPSAHIEHVDFHRTNVHEIYDFDVRTKICQPICVSVIVGQK